MISRIALIIITMTTFAFSMKLGPAIGVPSSFVGFDLRFTHFYDLRPNISFQFGHDSTANEIQLELNNNFYLPNIAKVLQQYIGISPIINLGNGFHGWNDVSFSNYYGLQYDFIPEIGVFAQVGYKIEFNKFRIFSLSSGLGFLFYIHE